MASQKQPTPRTLSPEIPVVSYPTPNTNDLMVVQDVDTRLPGYVAANYGDLHPDQATYPGLKLVFQTPLDQEQNFMWVRRVYAKDRADQDAYNYAIKYSGSDPNFPTYIRTYTIPRSEYSPLPSGSVDPLFPVAPNGNDVVLNTEEVSRYKDESDADEKTLDSQYVKVTRVYITLPGPTIYGGQVDSRYGIPVLVEKQAVPAGVGPSIVLAQDGSIRSSDIDPVDTLQSNRLTSILPALPEPQVWYGTRQVSGLPPVLVGAEIVGTEQLAFVPHFEECPEGPHVARYTRTFSFGPPSSQPSLASFLSPQSFNSVIEYSTTRISYSSAEGNGTNSSTSSATNSSTQDSTTSSTQTGTHSTTQTGTSSDIQTGTHSSTQTGTSSSTQNGTNSSTQDGTHYSTSSGTNTSTQDGTHYSDAQTADSSQRSEQHTAQGSGNHSGTDSKSYGSDSLQSVSSAENAPVINGSSTKTMITHALGDENSSSSGTNYSDSSGQGTTQSTGSGTSSSSGTNGYASSGSGSSSSSGTSGGVSSGMNSSAMTGTNSSTLTGISNSSVTSTTSSAGTGTSSSSTSGTGSSTISSTSSGTSSSTSQYTSTSSNHNTGKSLLSIQLPKCLRGEINITHSLGENGDVTINIPATNVSNLPYNSWYELGRTADYWKYGVWVTELVEVYLRNQ